MAQLSFSSRHPRTTIFAALLGLVSLLFLANSYNSPQAGHHYIRSVEDLGYLNAPRGYLASFLAAAEAQYQEAIFMRGEYIRRWEGLDGLVLFPTDWHFYTVWDFFIPAFSCPHQLSRIGILGDGGKWVCGAERVTIQPDCVVYSFGVGSESSFEAGILSKSSYCQVYGFDHTTTKWAPEVTNRPEWDRRAHFFPFRLSATSEHDAVPPRWTLTEIMEKHGHTFIDILKIDIEGDEFEVLDSLIDYWRAKGQALPFGQLQLEVHTSSRSFQYVLSWWEKLEAAGLRPFFIEPNLPHINYYRKAADVVEWAFITIAQRHYLISDDK